MRIKDENELPSKLEIGFGFTSERNVFQPNRVLSCYHEEMVHSKSFEDKSFSRRGDDVSTSSSAHIVDPEVLPQGPVTRERTRIQELKPSSLEAQRFVCSSFQLNEADTPSASSIQLNTAPFSSTSAPLAQLKLNNPEAAETHPAFLDEDAANSSNFMAAIDAFLKHSSSSSFRDYAYYNSDIETI
ncbi:hypothetical protein GQ457_14G015380 [Hibiscus cannabinus]